MILAKMEKKLASWHEMKMGKKGQHKDMKWKAQNHASMKTQNGEQQMRLASRHKTNTKKNHDQEDKKPQQGI